MLAYLMALLAAAAFAAASALEHGSAGEVPDARRLAPRQLAAFMRATVRHPKWLAGMLVSFAGFVLHAVALHNGALAVVQPLLVCALLFALPLNRWLRRERITAAELGCAAALVIGLGGFLLTATAGVPASNQPADQSPAVAAGILAAVVIGSLTVSARRSSRGSAAVLLGAATGLAFAITATLIKACTNLLSEGVTVLLTSWQPYALLFAGSIGLLLNQLSFQAGPLSLSLPTITVVNPLVAVLLGVVVYDEDLRNTPPAIAGEVAFLALMAFAAIALTRLEQPPSRTT